MPIMSNIAPSSAYRSLPEARSLYDAGMSNATKVADYLEVVVTIVDELLSSHNSHN